VNPCAKAAKQGVPADYGSREAIMQERLGLGLIPGVGWRAAEITEIAKAVEDAGFDAVFAAEVNNDVLATVQLMGEAIERIKVGSWVANIYLRHPYVSAQAAALIADLTGGRLLAARRYAEGLEQVARGFDIAVEIGEQWYVPRLHRVRAELLLQADPLASEAAEGSLRQALAVSRQQDARGWELQAAVCLARLWLDRGDRGAASDLLAPIYRWFSEGFDTPDLRNARMLLDALG
jgi:hypothetical protein